MAHAPQFVHRPPRRAAFRIAIAYAVFGVLWILFSDLVLEALATATQIRRYHLQTAKGWFFVVITAVMVYVLIRKTVSAFRETEASRFEVENQLQLLIERARDYAIFTLDDDGKVTSWNRGAQQITDWRQDEIIGEDFSVFYPRDDATSAHADLDRARAEDWTEAEAIRVRQDGSEFWANVHITALKERDSTGGFLVVLRDITERRRVQDALRQVNQTLATVIDNSPLAIVTLDLDGRVRSWNSAAEHLFGWKSGEVVGQKFPAVPEARRHLFEEHNQRLLKGQRLEALEVIGQCKDGSPVDIAVWGAPLADPKGNIHGNVRLYADISQRKHWEKELREFNEILERRVAERTAMLEEANEELQAFSFTVSHDLRLPLRSLQAIARDLLITQAEKLDETGRTDALRIVGAGARMERQIEDLLEYSRISREELNLEPVSLVLIVHELIGRLERDPAYVEAQFVVQEPLGWVKAHRLTLQYVILNLLVNAVSHVGPNARPSIHISAEEMNDDVRLIIEDNSTAPASAERDRLIQAPNTDGNDQDRLGLALVRRGITRMGGQVGIDPAPTAGTRYWIQLPRAD